MQQRSRRQIFQLFVGLSTLATGVVGASTIVGASVTTRGSASSVHRPATITTTTLPAATIGTPYSTTLNQTGATGSVRWLVRKNESLPRGLRLFAKTGVIAGIPRAAGTSTVDVLVISQPANAVGRATLTITVNGAPVPSATSATLPSGIVGVKYTTTLAITGGTGPYRVSLARGELPRGLHLGTRTGTISGIPSVGGAFAFTLSLQDRWHATAAATFTMVVAGNARPVITTSALRVGTVGVAYQAVLEAGGGCAPFAWSIRKGELPSGLSLSPSTGVIRGTPRHQTPRRIIHVRVVDANEVAADRTFTMVIAPALAPVINTTQLPAGTLQTQYSTPLTASGGAGNYRWAIASGNLPKGLFLDSETGVISGTPSETVVASFTVAIRDRRNVLATQSESLTILSS